MAFQGFGKPKYGGGGWGNQWKVKEGDNPFRILPPMHSFAESGKWSAYCGIHFGYSGADPQDAARTRQRPFRCIEQRQRNGLVEQDCPECTKIQETKDGMEARAAQLIAAGTDKEIIATELASYVGWLKAHNVDRKHYLNVMIPSGEVGFFLLSHRTKKKQLDEKIKELQKQHIDPIDPDQGVWFNVRRVGKMIDAVDTVEVIYDDVMVNGRQMKDLRPAKLDAAQCEKALAECHDLASIGVELTYEQISALTTSPGDPEDVDAIFARSAKAVAKTTNGHAGSPPRSINNPATAAAQAPDINNPAVQARLAALMTAKRAADAKAADVAKAADAAKAGAETAAMSDEAFLSFFKDSSATA